ncbi:MAG: mannitol-1-phosphate 5-dehydrogenase, partial [Rubrobacteraceae bacterium]
VERARRGGSPVNVIACENLVGGSQALRGFVMENVPDEHKQSVEDIAGFPNAAVDRIVPEQGARI